MASEKEKSTRGVDWQALEKLSKQPVEKGDSWFFGIGINQYDEFPDLNNAVKDVRDIQQILTELYDIQEDKVITLFDEAATKENIIDTLDQLAVKLKEDDKLLIYYSGHGHLNPNTGLGYWIPNDADRKRTSRYILNSTVRDYIKVIKARHILLISDSCFSGSLFVRGASRSTSALDELASLPSRWAICSGRHDEEVYDGEPGSNSPFAGSILTTLRSNHKSLLNVAKLADRVVEQTRANYEQLPEGNPLYGVGHKGGQYIFRMKANEAEDWMRCLKANTAAAYQLYIEKYPEGKHLSEAKERLAQQKEEEAWEKAREQDTIAAYFQFDQQFPNGKYSRQSLERIRTLEEDQAWQKARDKNTIYALRKYTLDYPNGKYLAEAQQRLAALASGTPPPPRVQKDVRQATPSPPKNSPPVVPHSPGNTKKWWLVGIGLAALMIVMVAYFLNRSPQQYEGTDWKVVQDSEGLYGYQLKGKWVLKPAYEKASPFSKGTAKVMQNGFSFFINTDGKCVRNCPEETASTTTDREAMDRKEEERLWSIVKRKDEIGGYLEFIEKMPNSHFVPDAKAVLREKEKELFAAFRRNPGEETAQQYLQFFPEGIYADDIEKEMEVNRQKEAAQPNTMSYTLHIRTGNQRGAGTDANVFIRLIGDKGRAPERRLNPLIDGNAFENSNTDKIVLSDMPYLGEIQAVVIRHDNQYPGAAWHLDWVRVSPAFGRERHKVFKCDCWLQDDQLERELTRWSQ